MSINGEANRDLAYFDLAIEKLSRAQKAILKAMEKAGRTRHELAEVCNMPLSSVCGRVSELEEIGLVKTTSEKKLTQHGKPATIVVNTVPRFRQGWLDFDS
jgi:predicted transcriptional regulator